MPEARKIVIAIPVWNGQGFIGRAIDSALAQSYEHIRICVLDNGSTDRTAEIVGQYSDPRLEHIVFEHTPSLAGSLNRGLQFEDADFVAILHADDVLRPSYVARMLEFMDEHPRVDVGFPIVGVIDSNNSSRLNLKYLYKKFRIMISPRQIEGEKGLARLLRFNFLAAPAAFFRMSPIVRNLKFHSDYKYMVDLRLWVDLLLAGGVIGLKKQELFGLRVHDSQLSEELRYDPRKYEELNSIDSLLAGAAEGSERWEAARKSLNGYRRVHRLRERIRAGLQLSLKG